MVTCEVCSYPIQADHNQASAVCERCGKSHRFKARSAQLTFIFSLTALIFYIPANLFPFMTMELYGNRNTSTIWSGILSLSDSGSLFLAFVVFFASMFIPLIKLIALFYLSATSHNNRNQKFKTKLYYVIEAIGRWSMLDIFLLAVLVAMVKLGHWTTVEPEMGSMLFALVVIFTLLASANFDAKLIWERKNENN